MRGYRSKAGTVFGAAFDQMVVLSPSEAEHPRCTVFVIEGMDSVIVSTPWTEDALFGYSVAGCSVARWRGMS